EHLFRRVRGGRCLHEAVSGARAGPEMRGGSPVRRDSPVGKHAAKVKNYSRKPPASSRNRLRTRALALTTALTVIPSSAATSAAGRPSTANCWNASQVDGSKSDLTADFKASQTCLSCSSSNCLASKLFESAI